MSLDERRKRGRKLIGEMMGAEQAERTLDHWDTICADFGGYVTEFLAGEIWSRSGLDLRTKSLVTIAALAALGRTRALDLNIRIAVNNGASRQDIAETLLQIAPYAGFPACWEGLAIMDEILADPDRESA